MTGSLFNSTTVPVLEQWVGFTQARHEVLAGNVANSSTPGYRTRDLSVEAFQQKLSTAIQRREQARALPASISSAHIAKDWPSLAEAVKRDEPFAEVSDAKTNVLYHDESNLSLEHQVNELNKNKAQHDMAINLLRSQFALLQAAISERA